MISEKNDLTPGSYADFLHYLDTVTTEEALFSRLTFWFAFRTSPDDAHNRADLVKERAKELKLWNGLELKMERWAQTYKAEFATMDREQFSAFIASDYAAYRNGSQTSGNAPAASAEVFSSAVLERLSLPPLRYVVPGILPMGLGLLVAKPKVGKSWMVLDLVLSVAAGSPFLGFPVNQSGTLYLALEDGKSRLQSRQRKIMGANAVYPENAYFATKAPRIDEGLLDWPSQFLSDKPDIHLVVIDTLAKVKSIKPPRANENLYLSDYEFSGQLKEFADKRGICILIVHHTSKGNKSDSFDKVNGSTALMGAADFTFVLDDVDRERREATLNITGRDIECQELAVRLDPETMRWSMLGSTAALEEQRKISDYESNPIVLTLREILQQRDGKWTGSSQKLNELGEHYTGEELASSSQALAKAIRELEPMLKERDCIRHMEVRNGSGGKIHSFKMDRTDNINENEEFEQTQYL